MNGLPLEGVKILVVDDDPRVRSLYAIVLREAGAMVTASGTAAEAVHLADLEPADVVITDLRMPGYDGIWLLHQLKAHRPALPVILVTGDGEAPRDEDLRGLGFAKILRKPLILSYLTATVSDVVGRPESME
jgi:DNA-binding NtrC family response regulator